MLDIHQLNVFLIAAETLNFTQAAHRLKMSQPSVSQHIQALERHFTHDLFIRYGRSLELTDAGLALIPFAREAVNLSVRIEEMMASMNGNIVGHLTVGCSTTPGKYILPQLLARFHHLHPQVRVTCQVAPQQQTMQMLDDGAVHFALTSLSGEYWPDAEFHKFICDRVCLITPLTHPWAERGSIQTEELYEAEYILREESSGTYTALREALGAANVSINDFNILLILGNSEAISMSVQEGLGVGFISEMVIDRISRNQVAKVKINGIDICRDIYIGRNIRRPTTAAQHAFWEFINQGEVLQIEREA
jgi:DNA-binding transcriptional LysR family regulator